MSQLSVGTRVYFDGPNGRVHGTVIRVNRKTVSVDPGGNGEYYRVPAEVLHVEGDPMAGVMDNMKFAMLIVTQDQLVECLQAGANADAAARLERVAATFNNPGGRLVIVADREDVARGLVHGWNALALFMHATASTLSMAGRLHLQIDGYANDPRELFQIPETKEWLVGLQSFLPWLGAWLDPHVPIAFQLVGALAPWRLENGAPVREGAQVEAAIHIANYAVAYSSRLGDHEHAHVNEFLRLVMGIDELPEGFFDTIDGLASELDEAGRRMDFVEPR